MRRMLVTLVLFALLVWGMACRTERMSPAAWDPFLDTLEVRTLRYFLETIDPTTGLAPDRWPSPGPCSIAAVGFALSSYPIAVQRGLISRQAACERLLATFTYLLGLPQSSDPVNSSGYRGFFYHFLDLQTGRRTWRCELSTIDTALLMAGVLLCQSYFSAPTADESELRALADSLYRRVEWDWAMADKPGIALGWTPERGFDPHYWKGYNEAMILYILALGSPVHPVPASAWKAWTASYLWAEFYGQEFISFAPLFGHQFSHCWIDFRGIQDDYTRAHGIDYFENSRRATYSQRAYAIHNPGGYRDYADTVWGFSACDGPGDTILVIDGTKRQFIGYGARGPSVDWTNDDGTITPCAVAGSLPFAPEICIPALNAMRRKYGALLWTEYGFRDAFNPTFVTPKTPHGWFASDFLGIDQGVIALMVENLRSGLVWDLMKRSPYVRAGLRRAGFAGGWLDSAAVQMK
ncbi:MAG: glucoamylase family protein [Candidatus Oleimicrobiaceae bacterium]